MTYPAYLKERAREMRVTKMLTLDEIAERLALPKTTVYYWIVDLPLARPDRANPGQRKGSASMQAKYRKLRENAYQLGCEQYDQLILEPTFRDFVVLYIAEGYKRSRNTASVCNSDPVIVCLAAHWMRRLSGRRPVARIQYHADQDGDLLRRFWADLLSLEPASVRLQPKSNSGRLGTRTWRCVHGVVAIDVYDTLFRARIQAWMDRVREAWS